MKKIYVLAAICSITAFLAVSCSKENQQDTPENTDPQEQVDPQPQEEVLVDVSLTAGVEDSADTKVFSSGNTFKWNGSADKLAVFANVSGDIRLYQFDKASGSSATSAEFTGRVPEGCTLKYASYAYSADRTCVNDVLGLFLGDQTCDAVNSVPHNTPLYGIISGGSVTMKSPCAFMKVMLPKKLDDTNLEIYSGVTVSAANCAGNFTVDLTTPATPVVSSGDASSVSITPKSSRSGYVYVPILPGTYDDITIEVAYNDGHSTFSRSSTTEQTFVSGYAYDCHEVAGPYVESVTTGAGEVEETTLSMAGSAAVWKYAGVTNSDYTCKFFYAAHGTAKGDAGWTEVAASSVTGDGTAISFSASATVAAGAYDFYAQVSDGDVTIDGDVEAATAKVVTEVVWTFADIAAGTGSYVAPGDAALSTATFTYNNNVASRKMITDSVGNPVFPTFNISGGKATFYYREWDGSSWGAVTQVENGTASSDVNGMLGGSTSIVVDGDTYTLTINQTTKYYTFYSSKLCAQKGFNMRMVCPDGFTIKRVVLSTASSDTCNWGIGTTGSSADKVAAQAYSGGAADITIPSPVTGQDLFLINNNNGSRLQVLTVYYEH